MVRTFDGDDLSDVDFRLDQATASARAYRAEIVQASAATRDLGRQATQFNTVLATGVEALADNMSEAFERFARTGKFSFEDLKNVAVSVLDEIYNQAITAGLNSIFGGAGGGRGPFGSLVQGLLGSFAPRAQGGPVSAGRPYLIGESGPELFVPRADGRVIAPTTAQSGGGVNITINMAGGGSQPAMRQSASQIAAQVSRAVERAQRNG